MSHETASEPKYRSIPHTRAPFHIEYDDETRKPNFISFMHPSTGGLSSQPPQLTFLRKEEKCLWETWRDFALERDWTSAIPHK